MLTFQAVILNKDYRYHNTFLYTKANMKYLIRFIDSYQHSQKMLKLFALCLMFAGTQEK